MLSAARALRRILAAVPPLKSESVKLQDAHGRVLAKPLRAHRNIPPFDNSSMDGFAVRSKDLVRTSTGHPVSLGVRGESSAGKVFRGRIGKGEAVRIMTGGKLPAGSDCVVPVEQVTSVGETAVQITVRVPAGANVRRAGGDIRKNSIALRKGELLTPGRIGIAASLGYPLVRVARKPVVSILATGDELVRPGKRIGPGQIYNSNSYALAAFVEASGATPFVLDMVGDRKNHIQRAVSKGLRSDILLVTGGVSVGKYDLVKDIFLAAGIRIKFWRVNIKPGKPLVFGTFGTTLVFGLPGNPVSASVTFIQFVRPAIFKMLGRSTDASLRLSAILDEPLRKRDGKRHFVRGNATSVDGVLHVRTTGSQSSGVLSSVARANCLIILPEEAISLKKGSRVDIELFPF